MAGKADMTPLDANQQALAERAYPWAVRTVQWRHARFGGDMQDMLSAACWAVMRAARKWQDTGQATWKTYAIRGIRMALSGPGRIRRDRPGRAVTVSLEHDPESRPVPSPPEEAASREAHAALVLRLQRLARRGLGRGPKRRDGRLSIAARAVLADTGSAQREASRLAGCSLSAGRHLIAELRREMRGEESDA